MTIQDAITALRQKYPLTSFCVSVEVWDRKRMTGAPRESEVEWAVWSTEDNAHYYHPTLVGAVDAAINHGSVQDASEAVQSIL